MARRVTRAALAAALLVPVLAACATGAPDADAEPAQPPAPAARAARDTTTPDGREAGLVPAGFGTLRQEDVAVRLRVSGVALRAIPLDESIIRVLSPDSYRALHDLARSRRAQVEAVARRHGIARPALWYVQFFGVEQGEGQFQPLDVVITSAGRDFRPLDAVPVTPGFGEGRIRQRETQAAVYVFDGALDANQPLSFAFAGARDDGWETTLRRIEAERTLARARAAAASGNRRDSTRLNPPR